MEDFIQIKEENVIRVGIKDKDGNDIGLILKFDLQDLDLPLRISKMEALHRKNQSILRQHAIALEKEEDKKGKFLLSWKKERKIELLKEHYRKEIEALDLLLGQGMTSNILKKLDREPYYNMFDDIVDELEPIIDKLNHEADNLLDNIKQKYGVEINEDSI